MARMKIMAVDDNTVNLATIEQTLKDEYDIIPMINGNRAIKYLYNDKVDLILLDVQMPVRDGVQTLREIRKLDNGVTVPVIFLTAMKDRYTVIEGSKLGIMDYITKPFDGADLKKRIDHVFKRMGIRPIETSELISSIKDTIHDLENDRKRQAAGRMDELLGYQVDDEFAGRVRNARSKIDAGDVEAARLVMKKVLEMVYLSSNIEPDHGLTISDRELYAKLLVVQKYMQNFKTKEAIRVCEELMQYMLPENKTIQLKHIMNKLIEYDDQEVERALQRMMSELGDDMN